MWKVKDRLVVLREAVGMGAGWGGGCSQLRIYSMDAVETLMCSSHLVQEELELRPVFC